MPKKKLPVKPSKDEQMKAERLDNASMQFNFDDQEKQKIVKLILEMVRESKAQRSEWESIRKESIDLYEGKVAPKNIPYEGCSNISTMVTTTACDTVHSRLFPVVWNEELIYWKGQEKYDKEMADTITEFMKWVIRSDMKLQNLVDDACQNLVVDGTMAVKITWNPIYKWVQHKAEDGTISYEHKKLEKCKAELVPIDRVFLPYNATDDTDCEYIIHQLFYTQPQLKEMQARGFIFGVDAAQDTKLTNKMENQEGITLARMDAEGTQAFLTRKEAFANECYDAYIKYDWNGDGIQEECVFLINADTETYLSGKPLVAISKIEERPWVISPFIRRPGRILGKSVPELTRHLHKEMNAIHNQRIDAGNFLIAPWFFYRPSSGLKPDQIKIGPGVGVPLDDPDRDVRFPNIPTGGITISFQEEKVVLDLIERLTSVSAYQLGKESEVVKSRATARGTMAIIQQGEQKFTIIGRRVQACFARMLTKILHQYQQNFPEDLQRRVLGEDGKPLFPNMAPEDILGQYDAYMVLDATAGSAIMEREVNMGIYQAMAQDPYVTNSPARGWEIRADMLRSQGKRDVERIIGPKPPSDDLAKLPQEENARMAQGEAIEPKQGEDHAQHLTKHTEYREAPEFIRVPAEYKSLFDNHMNKTRDLYDKEMLMGRLNAEKADGGGAAGAPAGLGNAPGMGGIPGPRVPGLGSSQGLPGQMPGGSVPPREAGGVAPS